MLEFARTKLGGAPRGTMFLFALTLMHTGCTRNPYIANSPNWQPPAQVAGTQDVRLAELQRRNRLMDDNNRMLEIKLAQVEQKKQVLKDELGVVKEQLARTTGLLNQEQLAARQTKQRLQGLQASTQLRGNATVTANTNLSALANRMNLGRLSVQVDGDVLRIPIPTDHLFQPGTAQPHAQATGLLAPVAESIQSVFPRQRVGIEAYADNSPLYGGRYSNPHQLTAAQSLAVLDILKQRGRLPAQQLFTMAMGARPRTQSTGATTRAVISRRVEIVIYPERY